MAPDVYGSSNRLANQLRTRHKVKSTAYMAQDMYDSSSLFASQLRNKTKGKVYSIHGARCVRQQQ